MDNPVSRLREYAVLPGFEPERPEEDEKLDLIRYWRIVTKHKWGILALAVLAGIITAVYAFSLEPVYRATATMMMEPKATRYAPVEDVVARDTYSVYRSFQYFHTQQAILKSRGFAERVVDRTQLWDHPYFDPTRKKPSRARLTINWRDWLPDSVAWLKQTPRTPVTKPAREVLRARAIATVQGGLGVSSVENTMLLRISFESRDPALAADIANAVAETFIEYDLENRLETFRKATSWLTDRTAGLQEKVQASKLRLQEFREEEEIVNLEGGSTIVGKQMEDAFSRLVEARNERSGLETLYREATYLKNQPVADVASHPTLLNYPAVRLAQTAEMEAARTVNELGRRYGPKHPRMVAANTALDSARSRLEKEVAVVLGAVSKEYEIARQKEARLQREFDRLKGEAQELTRKAARLQTLEKDMEANQELYSLFLTRFKETNVASDVDTPNAYIVDAALVPGGPVRPNPNRMVAMAVAVALFAGILLAFLLEYLDNTLKTSEQVEGLLGVPALGNLPRLRVKQNMVPERVFLENPKTNFAESIRTLRTGVVLSGLDNPHKVVAVTSTVPSEGKTTVSINLALALGQLEKVLLVDADMRRASVGKHFELPKDTPGLSNLVAGTSEPHECIHTIEGGNLDILPSGIIPPNPQELLSSQRFASLLLSLSEQYDRLVVDTAPTQAVSDALLVATNSSAVVYVIKADATPFQLVKSSLKRLEQVNAPVVGAVLNQVNVSKSSRYYYGRYGRYGRYGYYYDRYYDSGYYGSK